MARRRRNDATIDTFEATIPQPVAAPIQALTGLEAEELRELLSESYRRRIEGLKLYEPMPKAVRFHECRKRDRIIVGSNRSGKTTSAAVEFARAVTGQDPYNKYPKTNGKAFVFGLTGKHLGDPIYEKLFRAGAYHIIKDQVTGLWRAYHGVNDAHRISERKPAPPLIPRRFVRSISWDKKRENIPRFITFTTGWEVHFFSALAEIPKGQAIDLWWIDEEPGRDRLVAEMHARVVDRGGRGIWSVTPEVASMELFELHDRAGDADVEEVHLHIQDNPHIPQENKEAFFRSLTDQEREVKWEGRFLFSAFLVYPEFSKVVHAWPNSHGWQVPSDWALFTSTDPGRQVCAVTFYAVPPPSLGRFILAYDELYIEKCDADIMGRQVGARGRGRVFEAALIDSKASRITEMGSGLNIEDQYRKALVKYGFQMRHGVAYTWGSTDIQAGINSVHDLLRVNSAGRPGFYVIAERCPNLVREMERYRYTQDSSSKMPTDIPVKKYDHTCDTLRYIAAYGPTWKKPKQPKRRDSLAYEAFMRDKAAESRSSGGFSVSLGMGESK